MVRDLFVVFLWLFALLVDLDLYSGFYLAVLMLDLYRVLDSGLLLSYLDCGFRYGDMCLDCF